MLGGCSLFKPRVSTKILDVEYLRVYNDEFPGIEEKIDMAMEIRKKRSKIYLNVVRKIHT